MIAGGQGMQNWIVYLIGPPGVGKQTVAEAIAATIECQVVDNHTWLNPILRLVPQDGATPLPPKIWSLSAKIRRAILEAVSELSPPHWNFVFTLAAGDPNERDEDSSRVQEIVEVARRRNARAMAVCLTCAPEELARRVSAPERHLKMKDTDPARARFLASQPTFNPRWAYTLEIDTTNLVPAQIGGRIVEKMKSIEATA